MAFLEQLVRPFQTPEAVPDKEIIVTAVTKATPQKAIISWGAAGAQPKPYSTGLSFKVIDPFQFKETKRSTTDVRVENPDDSSQFVIEQRLDKISFSKKADATTESVTISDKSGTSGGTSTTSATKSESTTDSTVSDVTTETTKAPNKDENYDFTLTQPTS